MEKSTIFQHMSSLSTNQIREWASPFPQHLFLFRAYESPSSSCPCWISIDRRQLKSELGSQGQEAEVIQV